MHADRTNRVALIVFGLLVLIAGAAGLTASLGVFGKKFSHRTLFDNRVSTYIGHHSWLWYAVAAVCLLIAILALRWIVDFADAKKGMPMKAALAAEILEAYQGQGNAIRKRDEVHKMAQANKAFAHFRW